MALAKRPVQALLIVSVPSGSNGDMDLKPSFFVKDSYCCQKIGCSASEGIIAQSISADRSQGILVEVNLETDFVAKTMTLWLFEWLRENCLVIHPLISRKRTAGSKDWRKYKISARKLYPLKLVDLWNPMCIPVQGCRFVIHWIRICRCLGKWRCGHYGKRYLYAYCCHFPVCVTWEDVPSELVQKERKLPLPRRKPPQAIEKIVTGKLEKYYSGVCLLEQPFVKNPDQSIQQYVDEVAKLAGTLLRWKSFSVFR